MTYLWFALLSSLDLCFWRGTPSRENVAFSLPLAQIGGSLRPGCLTSAAPAFSRGCQSRGIRLGTTPGLGRGVPQNRLLQPRRGGELKLIGLLLNYISIGCHFGTVLKGHQPETSSNIKVGVLSEPAHVTLSQNSEIHGHPNEVTNICGASFWEVVPFGLDLKGNQHAHLPFGPADSVLKTN